jgi:hypothetical protein
MGASVGGWQGRGKDARRSGVMLFLPSQDKSDQRWQVNRAATFFDYARLAFLGRLVADVRRALMVLAGIRTGGVLCVTSSTSAWVTASGSLLMTVNSTRAAPSGLRRSCSHSRTVATDRPNLAAKSS